MAVGRKNADYQHDSGLVFGTSYNITYQSNDNLKPEIEKALAEVDASLSPFNEKSVITHVNKNEAVTLDDHFITVFRLSSEIYKDTEGAFDITVAPLVNAWGFGFKNGITPDCHAIDSLMQFVGFDKVKLQDGKIIKTDDRLMLDCSAIAKGYGVDAVARLLESKGIDNYMVEIGGEIVASGENPKGAPWRIGVSKPDDDSVNVSNEIQGIINISNRAMATSGNYRNFYYKGGKKYAHTIDPKTGCPVQHSILSATVVSDECAKADAYATAFMVMGLDKAKAVLARHKDMMAYFIYSDDKGNNKVWYSPSLKANLEE
ncbi:MAG: FAD:protein FMN transferase [Prevotella sp.]|nr:FAD:protein FMN transferase [Prevotella sp.]MDY5288473.1 FAD:protein FMN transferase [Prevotella sp.]